MDEADIAPPVVWMALGGRSGDHAVGVALDALLTWPYVSISGTAF
jgi:hypothetical protein